MNRVHRAIPRPLGPARPFPGLKGHISHPGRLRSPARAAPRLGPVGPPGAPAQARNFIK
jgi:hypothetical protein